MKVQCHECWKSPAPPEKGPGTEIRNFVQIHILRMLRQRHDVGSRQHKFTGSSVSRINMNNITFLSNHHSLPLPFTRILHSWYQYRTTLTTKLLNHCAGGGAAGPRGLYAYKHLRRIGELHDSQRFPSKNGMTDRRRIWLCFIEERPKCCISARHIFRDLEK